MGLMKSIKENTVLYNKLKKLRFFILGGVLYSIAMILFIYFAAANKTEYKVSEYTINAPSAPKLVKGKLNPRKLYIRFGRSVAKIKETKKPITKGISISPSITGNWKWKSDRVIVFQPSEHWKINKQYDISFTKDFFSKHIKIKQLKKSFKTANFSYRIGKPKFYINPKDPNIKKAILTLFFTHPVNLEDIKDHFEIDRDSVKKLYNNKINNINLSVKLNKHRLKAFIHTDNLPIPDKKGSLKLIIKGSLRSEWGGKTKDKSITKTFSIPGKYDKYYIKNISFSSQKDKDDVLKRIFKVSSYGKMSKNDVLKSIEIYLLPKDRPELFDSSYEKNFHWSSPEEITDDVLKISKKLTPQLVAKSSNYSKHYTFSYEAKSGDYIYFKIAKGIRFQGGYISGKAKEKVHGLESFPQGIQILREGAILSLRGEKKITIESHDVKKMKFEVARVIPDQINHLISQTQGSFKSPYLEDYNFKANELSEIYTEEQSLAKGKEGEIKYSSFDFTNYLKKDKNPRLKHGLFLFTVKAVDEAAIDHYMKENEYSDYDEAVEAVDLPKDHRLVLVTDLGFLVKEAYNGSLEIFVQSIQTGNPVTAAKVDIIGKNGLSVISGYTNSRGHLNLPDLKSFTNENEPVAYVITKGDDFSYMPYDKYQRKLDYSRYSTGGHRDISDPKFIQAHLFSDRKIYRPGESFNIGIITKASQWKVNLEGIPVEIRVKDPRGITIFKEKRTLTRSAFEEFKYQLEDYSETGDYHIELYLAFDKKDEKSIYSSGYDGYIGSTQVKVEEFMPDRLKIKCGFNVVQEKGWISPDGLKGYVKLRNLFGSPSVEHRVTAKLSFNAGILPNFKGYSDYYFFDPYQKTKEFTEELSELKTDKDGKAEFDFDLNRIEEASYRMTFIVKGFEKGSGRFVRTARSIFVSSMPYLLGYKSDEDISYIKKNEKKSAKLIVLDRELNPVELKNIKTKLIRKIKKSVLMEQEDGRFQYEIVDEENTVSESSIHVSKSGLTLPLYTKESGNYTLILKDKKDRTLNQITYHVMGGYISESEAKSKKLSDSNEQALMDIHLNRQKYQPGEFIEVHIKAPYIGAGLITIEREKVQQFKWFYSNKKESVQRIQVPNDLEGNAYINVAFIRSPMSDEIYKSPLSYGVVPFDIDISHRKNNITLEIAKEAESGKDFPIQYKTDYPSKIIVYAVDEGILQLAKYKLPDPLNHFIQKYALTVKTHQILDLILPEYSLIKKTAAMGGGTGDILLNKNLNPFKKKGQKPVAFWSGIMDSSHSFKTVNVPIPDYFNGTVRVMAVAVNADKMGAAEKKAVIRNPFVIQANIPQFLSPGDELEISSLVFNGLKDVSDKIELTYNVESSKHIKILNTDKSKLQLKFGEDTVVKSKIKVLDHPGAAEIRFKVQYKDIQVEQKLSLSVRPASPYRVSVENGMLRKESKNIPFKRMLYPQYEKKKLALSYLPLGISYGLKSYLNEYPYGCTEQVVSKGFANLVLKKYPEFFKNDKEAVDIYKNVLRILQVRQQSNGAFGFWSSNSYVSDFHAVYAVHYMTEAKENKYPVPEETLKKALQYLKSIVISGSSSLYGYRLKAYALYLLTRNNVVTTSYLNALYRELENRKDPGWKGDLISVYLSGAYQLLQYKSKAKSILKDLFKEIKQDVKSHESYYSKEIRNAQLFYILLKHSPEMLKELDNQTYNKLLNDLIYGEVNTINSAYIILALDALADRAGESDISQSQVIENFKGHKNLEHQIENKLFPVIELSSKSQSLNITNSNEQPMFFQILQSGFDAVQVKEKAANHVEVTRDYYNDKGKKVKSINLGDEVTVKLTLRSTDEKNHENMAVVDLLPGGFEMMPESIRKGDNKKTWQSDFNDIREDRVLLFGSVDGHTKSFSYKMKAINRGKFEIPPAYLKSMYRPDVYAMYPGTNIEVK